MPAQNQKTKMGDQSRFFNAADVFAEPYGTRSGAADRVKGAHKEKLPPVANQPPQTPPRGSYSGTGSRDQASSVSPPRSPGDQPSRRGSDIDLAPQVDATEAKADVDVDGVEEARRRAQTAPGTQAPSLDGLIGHLERAVDATLDGGEAEAPGAPRDGDVSL